MLGNCHLSQTLLPSSKLHELFVAPLVAGEDKENLFPGSFVAFQMRSQGWDKLMALCSEETHASLQLLWSSMSVTAWQRSC